MFEVRPLTNQTWADLEALFELPGGSIVRGCWCMYYRKTGKVSVSQASGSSNKRELRALVRSGVVPGLVGDADGSPGGISLGPREDYGKLERSRVMKAVDDTPVWSIVCTYVAKMHRGNGYQHKLLAGAIDYAREQGVRTLEAYPVDKPERSHDDFMFFGSRSLYELAGFREVVADTDTAGNAPRTTPATHDRRMRSAGENLRLLCGELFLGQYSGCFELSKLLKLSKHVVLGRCGRLWRGWRRTVLRAACCSSSPRLAACCSAACCSSWADHLLACRRDTRLDTAVAVPAIAAVRATPRISPILLVLSPSLRRLNLRLFSLECVEPAITSSAGIRPLAMSSASPRLMAATKGAAHVFSYRSRATTFPGSMSSAACRRSSSSNSPDSTPSKMARSSVHHGRGL